MPLAQVVKVLGPNLADNASLRSLHLPPCLHMPGATEVAEVHDEKQSEGQKDWKCIGVGTCL